VNNSTIFRSGSGQRCIWPERRYTRLCFH
jgi:hypothetical protein